MKPYSNEWEIKDRKMVTKNMYKLSQYLNQVNNSISFVPFSESFVITILSVA